MKLFIVLIFLASCSSGQLLPPTVVPEEIKPPKEIMIPERRVETPFQVEATRIKVSLTLSNFNDQQAARMFAIGQKVEGIINSTEFKKKVVGFYTDGSRKYNETKDTNEQVYDTLTSREWDVKIELKSARKSTLGWTYPNTPWIWFNSRNFNAREDSGLAGTICHEWSHKLGYGHAHTYYRGRENTVPYGVGTICAQFYK